MLWSFSASCLKKKNRRRPSAAQPRAEEPRAEGRSGGQEPSAETGSWRSRENRGSDTMQGSGERESGPGLQEEKRGHLIPNGHRASAGGLNGSQRTLPSSASPSPSYMTTPLPPCPRREGHYVWGGGGGGVGGASPATHGNLPGSPTAACQGRSFRAGAGDGGQATETSCGVFSFSFGPDGGERTREDSG